jgi:hypothetical protein
MILFPLVLVGMAIAIYGIVRTGKLRQDVLRKTATAHLPTAIQAVVLVAQAGELVRVVEHTTIVNLVAAGLLLAIILATKSGTEGQLH